MSLRAIVEQLGGELFAGGHEALVPAPGHSPQDRSISLKLTRGRVVVHSFGGAKWQEVLDTLRERGLIDADNGPAFGPGEVNGYHGEGPTRSEKTVIARELWTRARSIEQTLADRHLNLRAIQTKRPSAEVLRYSEAAPLAAYKPTVRTKPALLAAITNPAGALTGIEMTYLDPDGRRSRGLRTPRKTVGAAPGGCSVKLDEAAPEMLVGEGVFTTLSASELFDLPGHAVMSIRNMAVWRPPEGVRRVLIAGDNGQWGQKAAYALQKRLCEAGLHAEIRFPPEGCEDWNALAQRSAREKGGEGQGSQLSFACGSGGARPTV